MTLKEYWRRAENMNLCSPSWAPSKAEMGDLEIKVRETRTLFVFMEWTSAEAVVTS